MKPLKYLGSMVQGDGYAVAKINRRIQIDLQIWRKPTGTICDKKKGTKLKGKLYKSVDRLAALFGMKALPLTKVLEGTIIVAEMRIL